MELGHAMPRESGCRVSLPSSAPGPVFRGAAAQGPAKHAVEKGNVGKSAIERDLDDASRRIREFATSGLEPEFDQKLTHAAARVAFELAGERGPTHAGDS